MGRDVMDAFDPPLDAEIAGAVRALLAAGVETFESCAGGCGHAYTEPTVRFYGDRSEGFRALAAAQRAGLPVKALRRAWPIVQEEPTGPWWELVFHARAGEEPSGLRVSASRSRD